MNKNGKKQTRRGGGAWWNPFSGSTAQDKLTAIKEKCASDIKAAEEAVRLEPAPTSAEVPTPAPTPASTGGKSRKNKSKKNYGGKSKKNKKHNRKTMRK